IPAVDNHGVRIISIRVVDYQVVRLNGNRGSLRDFDIGIHLVGDHRDVVSTDYRELVAELFAVIGTIIDVKVYRERAGIIVIGGELVVRKGIIIPPVDNHGVDIISIRVVDYQVVRLNSNRGSLRDRKTVVHRKSEELGDMNRYFCELLVERYNV